MTTFNLKLAALPLLCLAGLGSAQTAVTEFKFASSAPPTSPWAKQIDRTAADVLA